MGRAFAIDVRMRAVLLYKENVRQQKDICTVYGITDRTLRRWIRAYEDGGMQKLEPRRPGPRQPGGLYGQAGVLVLLGEQPVTEPAAGEGVIVGE